MLQPSKQRDTIALHEFDIECELLSRLEHPNIVQVVSAANYHVPLLILLLLLSLLLLFSTLERSYSHSYSPAHSIYPSHFMS